MSMRGEEGVVHAGCTAPSSHLLVLLVGWALTAAPWNDDPPA